MKDTIEWYTKNQDKIVLPRSNTRGNIQLEGILNDLTPIQINALLNKFPENARERSTFKKVVAQPETYFLPNAGQLMKEKKYPLTNNLNEANTKTSITPSYMNVNNWLDSDVWLYNISKDIVPDAKVRKIILAEGFLHEIGHSINYIPRHKGEHQILQLPDGTKTTGQELMMKFDNLFDQVKPISEYSSAFVKGGPSYDKTNPLLRVDEELAETITAYLLGFAFNPSQKNMFDPFKDRPKIKELTGKYLNAKLVQQYQPKRK